MHCVLFTNRKLFTGFRLVPKYQDTERHCKGVIAVILHYFTEFGSFGANYVTVVEVEPIIRNKNVAQRF